MESECDSICLQETKRENFDINYLKKFCPNEFDSFDYLPSIGASGGIITIWNSTLFNGTRAFQMISQLCHLHLSIIKWYLDSH